MILKRTALYTGSTILGLSTGASLSWNRLVWPQETIPKAFFFFIGSVGTLPSLIAALALLILLYVYLKFEVGHWPLAVSFVLGTVLTYSVAKFFAP